MWNEGAAPDSGLAGAVEGWPLRYRNLARELALRGVSRLAPALVTSRLAVEHLAAGPVRHAFKYRADSKGDRGVVRQVLRRADYGLGKWKQGRALRRLFEAGPPESRFLVVDGGANIGAASVYFHLAYPGCRILAIEPERGNCDLLRMNAAGLEVTVLQGAIGAETGTLYLQDLGRSDWGYQVAASGLYPVEAWTMDDILRRHGQGCSPFILKLDIEGAEEQVFSRPCPWLAAFPLVIVELHDWMFPGKGLSRSFYRQVAELDFDIVQKGENTFCFNNALLGQYYR